MAKESFVGDGKEKAPTPKVHDANPCQNGTGPIETLGKLNEGHSPLTRKPTQTKGERGGDHLHKRK